ncbi:aromatic acid exporter family protein [Wukongibacter baidiensis]|uniref:aromatic acid exporter family protein n=1 Tax=Wukongibacter baidiensis TaxID=1723361 RepID=UPI003D7F8631
MRDLLYRATKIAIGVVLSILISDFIGLKYSTTAGIICMISILDTRVQTYVVGVKRLITSVIAIIIATILVRTGGHDLILLGIFLMLFIPILTVLKSTEGLTVSTVLVSHIYNLDTLNLDIMFNEIALLLIGMMVAWVMTLHVPNKEKEIKDIQLEVEELIKSILNNMKLQLLNQCSIEDQEDLLKRLDYIIAKGLDYAISFNNNFVLKENSYFIKYFQMRRQQYEILMHMQKHFQRTFITGERAKLLSKFTEKLAKELNECNTGEHLLAEADSLKEHYQNTELPKTRKEFENRAVLYQYFNDLIYFIEIKSKFMTEHGEIKYCKV